MAEFRFKFGLGSKKVEVEQNGQIRRSLSMRELAEMMARGEFKEGDRIRPEGTDEWIPFSQLKTAQKVVEFSSRDSKLVPILSVLLDRRNFGLWTMVVEQGTGPEKPVAGSTR